MRRPGQRRCWLPTTMATMCLFMSWSGQAHGQLRPRPPRASRRPPWGRTALGSGPFGLGGAGGGGDPGARPSTGTAVEGENHGDLPALRNPAILMASEEFQLLDCEFCDDVIDVSDLEPPELEPAPA